MISPLREGSMYTLPGVPGGRERVLMGFWWLPLVDMVVAGVDGGLMCSMDGLPRR